MTLSRQLILLVVALVLVLFLGAFAISLNNTRDYLESQLASHAQDAATSLGLSVTAHVATGDEAIVSAMVNAMFHRGDYQNIRLEDLSGQAWIERKAPLRLDSVPAWFVRLFTLEPPEHSATMMSGWRQVGTVHVRSHPGLAYRQLWQTSRQMLGLFLAGASLVLLAGLIGLRLLLRPLKTIELQAEAICNREFPVIEGLPFTLEFRRVGEAMNRLSTRVSRMLSDSERLAAQLRRQAFQDPLTGMANRRQFTDVLEHRIADPELFGSGGLLLVRLDGLQALNRARGYAAGDALLVGTAEAITSVLGGRRGATTAHMTGADFAVLLEEGDENELTAVAAELLAALGALYPALDPQSPAIAHIGGTLNLGQSADDMMADADLALREAQREGPDRPVIHGRPAHPVATRSASGWRMLIGDAIEHDSFSLLRQPVLRCSDRALIHQELFLRIRDPQRPDTVIPAAVFMPMAESTGLAARVDRAVLGRVFAGLSAGDYPGRVAVNLSGASLGDPGLLDWVLARLSADPALGGRLVFEFPEYGAIAHAAHLGRWTERLRVRGVQFSLDHFGRGFSSFAHLRRLRLDYLKVDGSFLRDLEQHDDNRFLLRTIVGIAHGLDMQVVAEAVETEAVWRVLGDLGVDGGRGHWLGPPA